MAAKKTAFPWVPVELLNRLEASFPNRLPEPNTDLREIDRLIGRNDIVALLRREFDKQQNSPME